MRDITVDRPVDQSHFECNVCPWKSHLKRKVLHFNLTQHIETTNGVSPYSNINRHLCMFRVWCCGQVPVFLRRVFQFMG